MKRRGFTFVELMIATTISIFIMMAMVVIFYGVWTLAKGASDELQGAVNARFMRERLYYRLVEQTIDGKLNSFGLISATVITQDGSHLYASDDNFGFEALKGETGSAAEAVSAILDWDPAAIQSSKRVFSARTFSDSSDALQCVYLKKTSNKTTYYDRLVATLCRTNQPTYAEIKEVFGGK